MTGRERLLKAVNHETPDRFPIDLGGNQTGIHNKAYRELIQHLGIKDDDVKIMDCVQQLAQPCEELLERFHVDTRYVSATGGADFKFEILKNKRNGKLWHDFTDEFGVRWSMPDDQQLYMDITHHPLANATIADVKNYPFPKGDDPARFAGLREMAMDIKNNSPYAVISGISGVVYEICWYMRGMERWYTDMLTEPEFCEAMLDQTLKFWMNWFKLFLKEVGDVVDVIMIGDDLTGQHGPLFMPKFYRSIVKPRQKKLAQFIRANSNAKLWYHTCGNCNEYIPDLVDNGVQILNPVQVSADNMDPVVLKKKYGKDLVFWGGGCDSQHILAFGNTEEVKQDVRKNVNALKPGGGYVFNNVHNIQASVPAKNIVTMYDTAYENSFYK